MEIFFFVVVFFLFGGMVVLEYAVERRWGP